MQTLDNAIALRAKPTRFGGVRLRTEQDPERPNPTFIPIANRFAAWLAEHAMSHVADAAPPEEEIPERSPSQPIVG